ncbi:acetyl/propionyl/methylcrotonyl-CoA carboxylase subunit alpha [Pseudoteredinibacter isoporae]|uniref:acetyl/propionyl/methylcrotonyl-CoA carboxylase subunit alpha n=1 Tax=Pseudoteredinibacter isoporae TaxID=570281 RepID=UPI003103953B
MSEHNAINTILVANRGEIACRVIRTAQSLGYRTVAVYSEADANALHVHMADKAVCIGPAEVGQSYLNMPAILDAVKRSGADAVHPGYGFMSENADFANACSEAGVTFIGPPVKAIDMMGNKRQAKLAMLDAGVPCIPGYSGSDQSDEVMVREANEIGYPVMIKATAGGGGRGMRIAHSEAEMRELISSARSEAENAFGNGEIILEKAIVEPRHIEIQVFADQHGNCVYLGERDCSIQRRHQKVVEEAPSPFVTPELRKAMGEAAVRTAQACDYVGAGTVEFLVDHERNFYFLEMNTRLQVEHPVTELITGTDLVAWQIKVAAGEALPKAQDDIQLRGHAMEVRLYAEDPRQNFLPQTGDVLLWRQAEGDGLRCDHMLADGQVVSPHYDPMLAKMIAWGENRADATRRLKRMLEDSVLLGVENNRHFLAQVIDHNVFQQGGATTAFLADHFADDPSMQALTANADDWALACLILAEHNSQQHRQGAHWSSFKHHSGNFKLRHAEEVTEVTLRCNVHVQQLGGDIILQPPGQGATTVNNLQLLKLEHNRALYQRDGVQQSCWYTISNENLYLSTERGDLHFEDVSRLPALGADQAGSGQIKAVMDGAIVEVKASAGDEVKKGDVILIMEAMKMEHPLKADVDGVISNINVQAGDQVKSKQLLAEVQTNDE